MRANIALDNMGKWITLVHKNWEYDRKHTRGAKECAYLMVYATIRLLILTAIIFRTSIQSMWFNYANISTTDYSNWRQKWRGPRYCRHYAKYIWCIYNMHVYMKCNVYKTKLFCPFITWLVIKTNTIDLLCVHVDRSNFTQTETHRTSATLVV